MQREAMLSSRIYLLPSVNTAPDFPLKLESETVKLGTTWVSVTQRRMLHTPCPAEENTDFDITQVLYEAKQKVLRSRKTVWKMCRTRRGKKKDDILLEGPLNHSVFKDERLVFLSPSLPFLQILSPHHHVFLNKTRGQCQPISISSFSATRCYFRLCGRKCTKRGEITWLRTIVIRDKAEGVWYRMENQDGRQFTTNMPGVWTNRELIFPWRNVKTLLRHELCRKDGGTPGEDNALGFLFWEVVWEHFNVA